MMTSLSDCFETALLQTSFRWPQVVLYSADEHLEKQQ